MIKTVRDVEVYDRLGGCDLLARQLAAIYVDKDDHSDCGALLAWAMMMHVFRCISIQMYQLLGSCFDSEITEKTYFTLDI